MSESSKKQGVLSDVFKGMDAQLNIDFNSSNVIKHNLSKGINREERLKSILRSYLPKRFSISSGAVVSSDGEQSSQIDIIVYDALEGFPLYGDDGNQLFPIECVYAVIEVKSRLTKDELDICKQNILSVKNMQKKAYERRGRAPRFTHLHESPTEFFPVLGFVFSYDTSLKLDTLKKRLNEIDDKDNVPKNIDSIYILKKGAVVNYVESHDKYLMVSQVDSERVFVSSDKVLLYFYTNVSAVLTQAWTYPIKVQDYIQGELFGYRDK